MGKWGWWLAKTIPCEWVSRLWKTREEAEQEVLQHLKCHLVVQSASVDSTVLEASAKAKASEDKARQRIEKSIAQDGGWVRWLANATERWNLTEEQRTVLRERGREGWNHETPRPSPFERRERALRRMVRNGPRPKSEGRQLERRARRRKK